MREIDISADRLVRALALSGEERRVCLLDSCGVGRSKANLLIAGADPIRTVSLMSPEPEQTLLELDNLLNVGGLAAIFTISYDFGLALNNVPRHGHLRSSEPHVYVTLFDCLAVHDYERNRTWLAGDTDRIERLYELINSTVVEPERKQASLTPPARSSSNFTRAEYLQAVEQIMELIREGETYQTNLTQQLTVPLPDAVTPQDVFLDLRRRHPAAFAAYLERGDSTIVSASPEQFLRIEAEKGRRTIIASPIKGTRPRGTNPADDERLRRELLTSEKDRAENTMIVDLMRNDLGRVSQFGSVAVEELCRIEEHPTLFHLVSTVTGRLREDACYSDIIRATFPCGSITGAPKIRTMEIIDRLETAPRGLSMGALGCRIPGGRFGTKEIFEMSVAIRTMVIRDHKAIFNVGGGIVIDSDPVNEYEESMLKAKALLRALGADSTDLRRRAVSQ